MSCRQPQIAGRRFGGLIVYEVGTPSKVGGKESKEETSKGGAKAGGGRNRGKGFCFQGGTFSKNQCKNCKEGGR